MTWNSKKKRPVSICFSSITYEQSEECQNTYFINIIRNSEKMMEWHCIIISPKFSHTLRKYIPYTCLNVYFKWSDNYFTRTFQRNWNISYFEILRSRHQRNYKWFIFLPAFNAVDDSLRHFTTCFYLASPKAYWK